MIVEENLQPEGEAKPPDEAVEDVEENLQPPDEEVMQQSVPLPVEEEQDVEDLVDVDELEKDAGQEPVEVSDEELQEQETEADDEQDLENVEEDVVDVTDEDLSQDELTEDDELEAVSEKQKSTEEQEATAGGVALQDEVPDIKFEEKVVEDLEQKAGTPRSNDQKASVDDIQQKAGTPRGSDQKPVVDDIQPKSGTPRGNDEKAEFVSSVQKHTEEPKSEPKADAQQVQETKVKEKDGQKVERRKTKGKVKEQGKSTEKKTSEVHTKVTGGAEIVHSVQQEVTETTSKDEESVAKGTTKSPVSILYSQSDGRVLFLEAGKDFVDVLMNLLLLPLGCVMKLFHDNKADLTELGAVVKLFQSVEKMDQPIMLVDKEVLTKPQFAGGKEPLAPQIENGYVKENMIFTITDKLEVFPSSTIKSIALLKELQVENMADLKSIEIVVTTGDVLRLLRASLTSKSVLNHVFQSRLPGQQQHHQHDQERCERCEQCDCNT